MTGRHLTQISMLSPGGDSPEQEALYSVLRALTASFSWNINVDQTAVVGIKEFRAFVRSLPPRQVPRRRINEVAKSMLFWLIEHPGCDVEVYCTDCCLQRSVVGSGCRCTSRGYLHDGKWNYLMRTGSGLLVGQDDWVISLISLVALKTRGLPPARTVAAPNKEFGRKIFGEVTRNRLDQFIESL